MSEEIRGRGLGGGELPDGITEEEFLEMTKPDLDSEACRQIRAEIRERRNERTDDEDKPSDS